MRWGGTSFYRVLDMDPDERARLPPSHAHGDHAPRRTRPRASPRSPRSARRNGRGDDHHRGRRRTRLGAAGRRPRRRARAARSGWAGRAFVERQRSLGKLPVRERLDLLARPGHVRRVRACSPTPWTRRSGDQGYLAADGVVTGVGEIDGRRVAVARLRLHGDGRLDGRRSASTRSARLRELALRQRIPIVWLLDSAGARIQSTSGSTFAGAGALFREQVAMSGVVPQVAAMLGHCAAGTAYIPALADFVPMVKGTSSMALGGRHLVKAATGEDVTEEEMGGSAVHTKISRRRRPRGRRRRGVPRDRARVPLVLPVSTTRSRRRCARATDPGRPAGRGALRHRAHRAAAGVRHAQGDHGGRRRRRRSSR